MLKIALSGANGKMGKAILAAAKPDPEVTIPVKLIKSDQKINLLEELKAIDVCIDFSSPAGSENYLKICKELKIPMVIGTTGLSANQHQEIAKAVDHIPILYAPNMSIGANICYYLLHSLSKLWFNKQDQKIVEVTEVHHKNKKDSPSGTALKMAEIIKQSYLNDDLQIKFISKRIGNVKGRHQVKFINPYEELIIRHNVKNRTTFAKGALLAAKWIINKPNKLYSLLDVINVKI